MKKLTITSILALLLTGAGVMRAQEWPKEYLGLPGDNLNLYAVMDLFRESETLEGFERNLNDEKTLINNIDLNGDNMVDYITVNDYKDGNVHTIVLRAMISRNESQDVAVFTVEQLRNGEVQIQLIGDEALYGRNYIVEPIYAETPNPGYRGSAVNNRNVTVVTTTYRDIAVWPVVRFIYHPAYIGWRSSWHWGYYPVYWNPWRTYYWHYYYGYHYNWHNHYYGHYRHCSHYRYTHYNTHYYSTFRTYSPIVRVNVNKGYYKSTYSRPEQRRDGEARYASANSNRTTRSQMGTSTGTRERSTAVRTSQGNSRVTNSAATARRTSVATTRNAASSQRSVTNNATRNNTTPVVTRGATANRNSEATVSGRTITTPAATRSTAAPSRSVSATTPSAARGTANNSRSVSTAAPSANRRSATNSRSATTATPSASRNTTTSRSAATATHSVTKSTATSRSSSPAVTQRSVSKPAATAQRSVSATKSRSSAASTGAVRRSSSR